jgi:cytochrome P450
MELPPGPRTPATLNTARLAVRPLETLLGWHRRYGDMITVRFLLFGTGVYVADPQGIRELFTGDQSDLHAGEANEPLSPILGKNSVLLLDGDEHMRQRKLLLPPFQGRAVAEWRSVIREIAEDEVANWAVGSEVVVRERMRTLTFDVICRAVFGVAEPERVERLRAALLAVLDTTSVIFFAEGMRRDLGPWSPWGRFKRELATADTLIYEEIQRRRLVPDVEGGSDVLSLLLGARDENGEPMSDVELRDELMTMLAAGHETTATGLAWAFDLLLHNPAVLDRLRDELDGDDDAYLDAVVTETLRLRPVIDAAERTLKKPRTIAGWDLPAGIRVYPGIALVHRREDLYPNARAFLPERFLDGGAKSYTWLPFGGGIRRCIGAALAQAEMAEVLRVILKRVELAPVSPRTDQVVLRGITLAPRDGVRVRVTRRATPAGATRQPAAAAAA